MPAAAFTQVHCTNCGGLNWPSIIIAVAALIVSFAALYISVREHRELVRRSRARADLGLTLRVLDHSAGQVVAEGRRIALRVEAGIRNAGKKAAAPAVMNVVVPRWVGAFRWSDYHGEVLSDARGPADTDERLRDAFGEEHAGQWLGQEIPRVTLRGAYVRYVNLEVDVPATGATSVPVRVKVDSDDLPADQPEIVEELMISVRPPA